MVNDTISDLLTRIRNANLIKKKTVSIPLTRINKQIIEILEKQGFIQSFKIFADSSYAGLNDLTLGENISTEKHHAPKNTESKYDNVIDKQLENNLKVNKYSQEIVIYLKYNGHAKKPCITNLKRISKPSLRVYTKYKNMPKILGGIGIAILSTSKGIMTDREARFYKVGGEILCLIW